MAMSNAQAEAFNSPVTTGTDACEFSYTLVANFSINSFIKALKASFCSDVAIINPLCTYYTTLNLFT